MVRKTVTLVFCDVADSTPLGEQLDPEALRDVWSRYHATSRDVLERHGGTIEKFVGDAVMAVFGIPVVHEDDGVRAVRAAVELRSAIDDLNDELERVYGVRIGVRTGVNTGEVLAGDASQGQAFATGDAVVVAQRLEAAAGSGEILIGEVTFRLVRDAVRGGAGRADRGQGQVRARRGVAAARGRAGRRGPGAADGLAARRPRRRARPARARARAGQGGAVVPHDHDRRRAGSRQVSARGRARGLARRRGARARGRTACPYGSGITYWPLVEIVRRARSRRGTRSRAGRGRDPRAASSKPSAAPSPARAATSSTGPYDGSSRPSPATGPSCSSWTTSSGPSLRSSTSSSTSPAGAATPPILVCCLARSEFTEMRPAWPMLPLEPLPPDDAAALLEHLVGPLEQYGHARARPRHRRQSALPRARWCGCWPRTTGSSSATAGSPRSSTRSRCPETIQAVLAARLDRLGGRRARRAAARVGDRRGVLVGAGRRADPAGARRTSWPRSCRPSSGRACCGPTRDSLAGEDGFRFAHILVRDAAYDSTPKRLRSELHERFADWVERACPGAPGARRDPRPPSRARACAAARAAAGRRRGGGACLACLRAADARRAARARPRRPARRSRPARASRGAAPRSRSAADRS